MTIEIVLAIGIVAALILGILADWHLKSLLPERPTLKHTVAGLLAIALLVTIIISLSPDSSELPDEPSETLPNGLVAFYPFNGNANDVINGNDSIVHGPLLTEDRFGRPNSAYSFDGMDDYIVSADESDVGYNEQYTVALWFRYTQPMDGSESNGWLLHRGRTPSCKYEPALQVSSDSKLFAKVSYCRDTGRFAEVEIIPNKWHFVVMSVNGQSQRLYLDGEIVASGNKPTKFDFSSRIFLGGASEDGITANGDFYEGAIDDVQIYYRSLNSEEIQDLYNQEQ